MFSINSMSWGEIEVTNGYITEVYKDLMIWPDNCCEWNWKKDGTKHSPGITVKAVQNLFNTGANFIILSSGVHDKLKLPKETKKFLEDMKRIFGIEYVYANSVLCVALYQELFKKKRIGMLLHSTC